MGHHLVIATTSGLPVWSVQWCPSALTESVWRSLGQVTSQYATLNWYDETCFELSWFHLNWNPRYTKNIMVFISNACTEWCWSTHTFEDQWYPLQSSKLQVKAEFTETCPLAAYCPVIFSFQTDATLINCMWFGVCGLLKSLQWCSRVGCNSPVAFQCRTVSTKFFTVAFQCTLQDLAGSPRYPSIHWINQ